MPWRLERHLPAELQGTKVLAPSRDKVIPAILHWAHSWETGRDR